MTDFLTYRHTLCWSMTCQTGRDLGIGEAFTDHLGYTWCPACAHRGAFLDRAAAARYPALVSGDFLLAAGEAASVTFALTGDERGMALFAEALDALLNESEHGA